ncbi:MAG: cystathionine beta-synthase [Candidatus Cyclonatronum sp.]|uniref:cystathionine beta-synthase n=1 Tax=Cyclonatronum sp. TaxID=3024185 RepID=UPI0025BC3D4F|nr:cystathionine beta-synthase [Cyclonatronum sp.]MCH8486904.1 cystathionine beta-synthase [Cyclonatronum sp.]
MWKQSILETIGNTPLIKLQKVAAKTKATVLVKVEYFNPGQSVKDRIAVKMIEDAEAKGLIKPGGTIIEGTSGNTGMGLALAAAVKGYKCIFTTTDKQSMEKVNLLRALGAEVRICPTNVEPDDPRSYYSVAKRLSEEIPNSYYPNQYDNLSNRQAHYETTGPEIWEQTDGKVTHYVAGMGTGGTITGTAKFLKEQNSKIKVVGVDSVGSVYLSYFKTREFDKTQIAPYLTEGIGEDIIPANVDFDYIDEVIQCPDKEAFVTTRDLARKEGIFIGGSCGAAVWGALEYARINNLGENDVVVVILPDSGTRYVSKIYNDEWMIQNNFMEPPSSRVADFVVRMKGESASGLIVAQEHEKLSDVIDRMNESGISQVPVMDGNKFTGSVTDSMILSLLIQDPGARGMKVAKMMDKPFPVVEYSTPFPEVTALLNQSNQAVVVRMKDGSYEIITRSDLIQTLSA